MCAVWQVRWCVLVTISVMELIQIAPAQKAPAPKPEWLKARAPVGENYHDLKRLARSLNLHTVCESAHCPNIGECWHHKTATFMMLGNLCTRRCGFCAVPKGRPEPIDFDEPRRVAEAVAALGLQHAVITSVNRDDDLVGGARVFAMVIEEIRAAGAGMPGRGADSGFSGRSRGDQHRGGGAARGAEPQHRDGAAALPGGAVGSALRADAGAAAVLRRN